MVILNSDNDSLLKLSRSTRTSSCTEKIDNINEEARLQTVINIIRF